MRSVVEMDFGQFKSWDDGDRLRCTRSFLGKLFALLLCHSV